MRCTPLLITAAAFLISCSADKELITPANESEHVEEAPPDAGIVVSETESENLGESCEELTFCCESLPQGMLRTRCEEEAMSGDADRCDQALAQTEAVGGCGTGMRPDGGVRRNRDGGSPDIDIASLGPNCLALEACCDEAPGNFSTGCRMLVAGADEARCETAIGRANDAGICVASVDAGL